MADTTPPTTNPEPVVTAALIASLVGAIVTVVTAFGLDLTVEQVAAIAGLTNVVAPIVAAVIARRFVTSWAKTVATREPDGTITAGPAAQASTGAVVAEPETVLPDDVPGPVADSEGF